MKTYLSRAYSNDISHVRCRKAAAETGLDIPTVQTIFSELCAEDILRALVQVRCPYCNTQHGKFERRSEVPDRTKVCFNCDEEFLMTRQSNWEVIYRVTGNPGDFFQNGSVTVEKFLETARDLPSEFFQTEFKNLKNMENPQKRGRKFDYFIGLLFQQLPGVEIRTQQSGGVGEIDVHVICVDGPDFLYRMLGRHTLVENKWEKDAIEKGEISNFHAKANDLEGCDTAFFVSMSGFSRGSRKQTGALAYLRKCSNPSLRDLWDDDVEAMVSDGTPEKVLRNRMLK